MRYPILIVTVAAILCGTSGCMGTIGTAGHPEIPTADTATTASGMIEFCGRSPSMCDELADRPSQR